MRSEASLALLLVSLVTLVGFHSLSANWTPPTATPPNDNVAPAVNTGSATQNKTGNFMANIVAASASMRAPSYCDAFGNNCWTPSSGGSYGGGFGSGSGSGSGFGSSGGGQLYQCPRSFGCSNGTQIIGAWASYGCVGQVSNLSTCMQVWNNGATQSCTNTCSPI